MKLHLIIVSICFYSVVNASTFYSNRSLNQDAAQILIDYSTIAPYKEATDDFNNTFSITPAYTRTFKRSDITCSLFGDDLFHFNGRDVIRVSGSTVADRGEKDWLADYFGLRSNFSSLLSFEPYIENFILYLDWNRRFACNKAYFRLHTPLVHTRWSIELTEHNVSTGCATQYPPGYFGDMGIFYQDLEDVNEEKTGIPCRQLLCSIRQYLNDCLAPNLVTPNNATTFEPLQFSKMSRDPLEKTHLAEIQTALGWLVLDNECYHLALEALVWFPTGNRPEAHFLFEPIVGNGHHWQIGLGCIGDVSVLPLACDDKELQFYWYGYVTHLFDSKQRRTFDLCNSPNSRYMLAQKMGPPVDNLLLNNEQPSAQFKGIFTPVANLTTFDVKVGVNWQVDFACMFQYRSGNFYWELGYNFWARACESIDYCNGPDPFNNPFWTLKDHNDEKWSLKGDSFVYGFVPTDVLDTDIANMPIPLSSTQHNATIHAGTNRPIGNPPLTPSNRNAGVDNAQFATLEDGTLLLTGPLLAEDPADQQRSSLDPIFLTRTDINLCSARTQGRSHKFFSHIGYTWAGKCTFVPSLGFGIMVELAKNNKCSSTCTFATPTQAGLWIKTNFSF